jgi:hypothetical protein
MKLYIEKKKKGEGGGEKNFRGDIYFNDYR